MRTIANSRKSRSSSLTIFYIATFSVLALFVLYLHQQSIAQEQQQPPHNRTASDTMNPTEQSFEIDNATFSHYKVLVNNGIQIHYVMGGQGYPIVLLHGWPETWYEWRHIIPELIANNYTVIAPDMRGFGDSEKPLTGYDKKTLADDIYQLVMKLG
jgi:alpha/beta hydrolase fold